MGTAGLQPWRPVGGWLVLMCLAATPAVQASEEAGTIDLGDALRQLRDMAGSRQERSGRRSDHALQGLVVVRLERDYGPLGRFVCATHGSFRMLPYTATHTNWGAEQPAQSTAASHSRSPRGTAWSRTTGSGYSPVGVALDQDGGTYELTINASSIEARQLEHHGAGNFTDFRMPACGTTLQLRDLPVTGERRFAGSATFEEYTEVQWSFGPVSAGDCTPDASPWAHSGRRAGATDPPAEQLRSALSEALGARGFTAGAELIGVEHADDTVSLFHLRLGSGAQPLPAAEFVIEQALAGAIPPGAGSHTAAVLHGHVERSEDGIEVALALHAAASGALLGSGTASAAGSGGAALAQAVTEALAATGLAAGAEALAALGIPTDPPPPACPG